jgi:hypothetical protein
MIIALYAYCTTNQGPELCLEGSDLNKICTSLIVLLKSISRAAEKKQRLMHRMHTALLIKGNHCVEGSDLNKATICQSPLGIDGSHKVSLNSSQ